MNAPLTLKRDTHLASLVLLQQRGFAPATFIDIGAAEGAFFMLRRQANLFPNARHFFIDAMQENEDVYRRVGEKFGTGYEITALSCIEGETTLRVDPNFYNTHIDRALVDARYENSRRVTVRRLDEVVKRHALQPPYIVKLDVQGGELDVLRGALETLRQSLVVVTEIQTFAERDALADLVVFMHGNGWAIYDVSDLGYYPSDHTFFQCYVTFIPKQLDFRADLKWCLPEQEKPVLESLRVRRENVLRSIQELLEK